MILGVVILFAIVVAAVVVLRRRTPERPLPATQRSGAPPQQRTTDIPQYLEALLTRWGSAGLMSAEQAESIRSYERSAIEAEPVRVEGSRVHTIAEAIGYIGGMLGLGGIISLLAEFWSDFDDAARLGIPLTAAVVFCVAGSVVPEHRNSAMVRLKTFVWLLGTAASAVTAWVFTDIILEAEELRQHWLGVGIVTAIVSGVLWAGRNRPVQQFTALAGVTVALGTGVGEFASVGMSGLAIWVGAVGLLAFSLRRTKTHDDVFVLAGSIAAVVGAYLTTATWMGPGLIFVIVTGMVMTSPAVVTRLQVPSPHPLIMGVAGVLALAQATPASLAHFANRAGVVTGLVVWISGILISGLVGLGILRLGLVLRIVSGALMIGGPAVTTAQSVGFGVVFGLVTAVALIVIGSRPGSAWMSAFGLVGLLVFIPWTIGHYFPGQGRAPVLIIVSGLVLVAVAVGLMRISGRLRGELTSTTEHGPATSGS